MSFVAARAGRSAGASLLRPSSIPRSMQRISGPRSSALHQLRPLGAAGSEQAHTSKRLAGTVAALAGGGLLVGMTLLDGQPLRMDAAKKESRRSFADRMKPREGEKAAAKEEKKGGSEKKKEPEAPKEDAAPSAEEDEKKPAGKEADEVMEEQDPLDFDDLSEEASQQSAFDPETNTINWDCPCLGGMADGPCGEQFKDAFSCFVFSEEEPKGVDCVDKFKAMQDCFRKYPEHYKEELEDDDEGADDEQSPAAKEPQSKEGSAEEDTDEGLREWRSEMEKEK